MARFEKSIVLEYFGIPIFMVGRKKPEVLKKRNKISFFIALGLLFVIILIILISQI